MTLLPTLGFAAPLDCVIEPEAIINLVSSEKGRISSINVRRGSLVKKGDVLVVLEDDVQRHNLAMAQVRKESTLEMEAAQARLSQRTKDLDRAQTLVDRNVAAKTQVEDAQIEVEMMKLAVEQAHLTAALAEIEYQQARTLLDHRTLNSPIDGVVVAVQAAPGAFASEQLQLLTLADIDPLHVEVFAPLEYYDEVTEGDVFQVTQSAPLTGTFDATVRAVDKVFDAASGTFGIQLTVPNRSGQIPAGTRCEIDLSR
ncbi:efflux RND transporter periplasmic adaptor subunit [Sulfitobacter sp.]|jgi:RND family efflux transporter MFP subunit|uniref:efflux RND transporter periplasmic adaptor subunit n=1 Tax=Sulfitobacter sp. TaxID=1903071 RepID=UPI0030347F2D